MTTSRALTTLGLVALLFGAALPRSGAAEPYRLRGTTFAETRAPAGLFSFETDARVSPWARAEALIWVGGGELGGELDALVAAISLSHPRGLGDAKLGRLVLTTGALRPVHADGAQIIARLPSRTSIEVYAGSPVKPNFDVRSFDWLVGARIGQNLGDVLVLGVAHLYQHEAGLRSDHEVGVDLGFSPTEAFGLAARAAYDLIQLGPSELVATASLRLGDLRLDARGSYRNASRILPATSLFSVLGDAEATVGSVRAFWRAAPRLDLYVDGGVRHTNFGTGEDLTAHALLRTDAFGDGYLGAELRRVGVPDAAWSGIRAFGRIPLHALVALSAEAELVRPDDDEDGALWPWALLSLSTRPAEGLEVAVGVEARSSPDLKHAIDGLLRLAYSGDVL